MNAKELLDLIDKHASPHSVRVDALDVKDTILRALRLLAAAEANDGTTPIVADVDRDRDYLMLRAVAIGLERERNGLAARVGELEKDAERSSKKIDFLRLELFSETTARKSAENELFAAIQDADRYRWLRVQRHADIAACWYLPVMPQDYPVDTPEQRDAAIDAARGSKP